jgi:hypothetical protein
MRNITCIQPKQEVQKVRNIIRYHNHGHLMAAEMHVRAFTQTRCSMVEYRSNRQSFLWDSSNEHRKLSSNTTGILKLMVVNFTWINADHSDNHVFDSASLIYTLSQGSSVQWVTEDWRTGVRSWGQRICLLASLSRRALGPTQAPIE